MHLYANEHEGYLQEQYDADKLLVGVALLSFKIASQNLVSLEERFLTQEQD